MKIGDRYDFLASGFFDHQGRIHHQRPHGLHTLLGVRQRAFDHLTPAHAWRSGAWSITGNVCIIDRDGCAIEAASDHGMPVLTSHQQRRHWLCCVDLGSAVWNKAAGAEALRKNLLNGLGL